MGKAQNCHPCVASKRDGVIKIPEVKLANAVALNAETSLIRKKAIPRVVGRPLCPCGGVVGSSGDCVQPHTPTWIRSTHPINWVGFY